VAGRTEVMVEEGKEPIEFWDALGGQGEYPECTADEEVAQVYTKLYYTILCYSILYTIYSKRIAFVHTCQCPVSQ
jgi:hypothetical protein